MVTGPVRRSLQRYSAVMRTTASRACVRTQGRRHAFFLALPPQVHGVVAVEGTTRTAGQGPGRTTARPRSTAGSMGRTTGRAARPSHTRLSRPASTKMLASATPSPGANCLARDEPELYQAVRADAERAQQGPSLAGAEVDTAGNQGGVDGTPGFGVAVAVGLAIGFVAGVVEPVTVVIVRAIRVIRGEIVLLSDVLLLLVVVLRAVVVCVEGGVVVQALVRDFTSQDKRRAALTAFQKPSRG